jgi:hypothetical protein
MATSTYVALATAVATGSQSTITFSAIPQTYTDLTLVWNGAGSAGNVYVNLNGDTNQGNYTITRLYGNGSSPTSDRSASFLMSIGTASNQTVAIMNLMNYSNTTTFKTALFRLNPTAAFVAAEVALWRNTAAVTQLDVISSSGNFTAGSTFTIYGIANADNFAKATGGMISQDDTYWYHTFASNGTFTPKQTLTCDYLVVAGGGGGANPFINSSTIGGGGGGAGGYRTTVGTSGGGGSAETPLSLAATSYAVTIGAGGPGNTGVDQGGAGTNSVFSTITSNGGGGGGRQSRNGGAGGSGGGASCSDTIGGAGTSNQGFAGSNGQVGGAFSSGAGGGGAGAAGSVQPSTTAGGAGGIGVLSPITGTYFAGGGGGGAQTTIGAGGLGGGGNGSTSTTGNAGVANTGGGAGGIYGNATGVSGGSGVVIIRYLKA